MASPTEFQPFRLFNLPRELRDNIYRNALCSFEGRTVITVAGPARSHKHAAFTYKHSINTALLLTCKRVYCEAFEIMIKVNRFVRVATQGPTPLLDAICGSVLPVISFNRKHIDNFNGFVLSIDLTGKEPCSMEGFDGTIACNFETTLMILARDLRALCILIAKCDAHAPRFSKTADLAISLGTCLTSRPSLGPNFDSLFHESAQNHLLQPFATFNLDYRNVEISGRVSPKLAEEVKRAIREERFTDVEDVLVVGRYALMQCEKLYNSGDYYEAFRRCLAGAMMLFMLKHSDSWDKLYNSGGTLFLDAIAKIYSSLNLIGLKAGVPRTLLPDTTNKKSWVIQCVFQAHYAIDRDFWAPGYRWVPSRAHLTELIRYGCMFFRLNNIDPAAKTAALNIALAAHLEPGDQAIAEEQQAVLEWRDRVEKENGGATGDTVIHEE